MARPRPSPWRDWPAMTMGVQPLSLGALVVERILARTNQDHGFGGLSYGFTRGRGRRDIGHRPKGRAGDVQFADRDLGARLFDRVLQTCNSA